MSLKNIMGIKILFQESLWFKKNQTGQISDFHTECYMRGQIYNMVW